MLNLELMFKVKQIVKIGEVSKIVGISSSAIRFYERHGLVNANRIYRAANGYRVYRQQDVEEIQLIIRLKAFGMELKEIKCLLSEDTKSCGDLVSSLEQQLEKCRQVETLIKKRIRSLQVAKDRCRAECSPRKQVRNCCA